MDSSSAVDSDELTNISLHEQDMSADCKILGLERLWSLGSRVCNETGTGWATGIILERYDAIQLCVGDTVAEADLILVRFSLLTAGIGGDDAQNQMVISHERLQV